MAKTPLQALTRHVDRFGSEGIMETAVELLTFEDLLKLQYHIDKYDKAQNKYARVPRLSVETRIKRLLGIDNDKEEESSTDS